MVTRLKKQNTNFENVAIAERSGELNNKALTMEYNYKYFYADHGKKKSLMTEILFTVYGEEVNTRLKNQFL